MQSLRINSLQAFLTALLRVHAYTSLFQLPPPVLRPPPADTARRPRAACAHGRPGGARGACPGPRDHKAPGVAVGVLRHGLAHVPALRCAVRAAAGPLLSARLARGPAPRGMRGAGPKPTTLRGLAGGCALAFRRTKKPPTVDSL